MVASDDEEMKRFAPIRIVGALTNLATIPARRRLVVNYKCGLEMVT